jgi:hypothetical protein
MVISFSLTNTQIAIHRSKNTSTNKMDFWHITTIAFPLALLKDLTIKSKPYKDKHTVIETKNSLG